MPLRLYGHPFLKPSNVRWLPMLGPSLRRWQRFQQAPVDQNLEVTRYAERECAISDENANFDVAVQGCFGQIRGGDKDGLVVGHDGLGMEYSRGAPELEGPGVEEHPRPGRTWPVCLPKTVGELAHMWVFPLLKSLLPVVVAFLLPTTDTLDHRRVGNGTHRHGLFQEPMEELPAMA